MNESVLRSPKWLRNFLDFEIATGEDIKGEPSKSEQKRRDEEIKRKKEQEKIEKEERDKQESKRKDDKFSKINKGVNDLMRRMDELTNDDGIKL